MRAVAAAESAPQNPVIVASASLGNSAMRIENDSGMSAAARIGTVIGVAGIIVGLFGAVAEAGLLGGILVAVLPAVSVGAGGRDGSGAMLFAVHPTVSLDVPRRAQPFRHVAASRPPGGTTRGQLKAASTRSTSSRVVNGLMKQKRSMVSPRCFVGITSARPLRRAAWHQAS